jgi:hypothetical protein
MKGTGSCVSPASHLPSFLPCKVPGFRRFQIDLAFNRNKFTSISSVNTPRKSEKKWNLSLITYNKTDFGSYDLFLLCPLPYEPQPTKTRSSPRLRKG